jgi:hypothetical protein
MFFSFEMTVAGKKFFKWVVEGRSSTLKLVPPFFPADMIDADAEARII